MSTERKTNRTPPPFYLHTLKHKHTHSSAALTMLTNLETQVFNSLSFARPGKVHRRERGRHAGAGCCLWDDLLFSMIDAHERNWLFFKRNKVELVCASSSALWPFFAFVAAHNL